MSIWWRLPLLSLAGIFLAIGGLGGFDEKDFKFVGTLVIMFWGIPIVLVTLATIGLEKLIGKYGRGVMTAVWAAPGLAFYVLAAQGGDVSHYGLLVTACFFGYAALWFVTAPRLSDKQSHP